MERSRAGCDAPPGFRGTRPRAGQLGGPASHGVGLGEEKGFRDGFRKGKRHRRRGGVSCRELPRHRQDDTVAARSFLMAEMAQHGAARGEDRSLTN
eukprot:8068914-Pyramimonas_sp.AAC.1